MPPPTLGSSPCQATPTADPAASTAKRSRPGAGACWSLACRGGETRRTPREETSAATIQPELAAPARAMLIRAP